jgi:hypothetical protein
LEENDAIWRSGRPDRGAINLTATSRLARTESTVPVDRATTDGVSTDYDLRPGD